MAKHKLGDTLKLEGEIVQFKKTGRKILYTISIPVRKHDINSPEKKLGFIDHDIYLTDLKYNYTKKEDKTSGKTKSGGEKIITKRRKRKTGGAT